MQDKPQGDREFQEAQQRNQHSFKVAQQQRQHLFEEVHQDIEHRHENLRDGRRRLFEARKEYAAHTIDEIRFVNEAFREYGLQTFKWAFLANAGAAALILALAGAIASRSNLDISITRHLATSVVPFGFGCVFVILGVSLHM